MSASPESFPRQRARTRGFRLGAPRGFTIRRRHDGTSRVAFIRSAGGRVASGDLWVADEVDGYTERLVVKAAAIGDGGDVPAAEQARRERLREVTGGITAYSLNNDGTVAAFALDGTAYRVTLHDASCEAVKHEGSVVDPRISPDGHHVAFVSDGQLFWFDSRSGETRCMTPEDRENITWGLADFIAAEELERHRGFWWLADSSGLLVERVDETPVEVRWIGDPAQPEREPVAHRYPAAGTANASVTLHRIDRDGTITPLPWDTDTYCYLATVNVSPIAPPLVSVLSRDQQQQSLLRLDENALTEISTHTHRPWITVIPGSPALDADGAVIDVVDIDGCYRLRRDGLPISPEGMNVEAILDVSPEAITVQAALEPTSRVVVEILSNGDTHTVTSPQEWTAAAVRYPVRVEVAASLDSVGSRVEVVDKKSRFPIRSLAETPVLHPRPHLFRVGERQLATAVVLPSEHEPGMRWPVICSPYGGPHAQRVIRAAQAYLTEQWLADQGFAVVITDGRGTPGRGPSWEYDVYLDLADPVLDDQVRALHDLAEVEPALDLSHVGIRGWSFGGYLAALAVMDRPDVFHAAVAGAPVTDWRLYDTAYTERYLGNPQTDDAPYRRTSLIERADRLSRPLLLIHGLADDNVLAAHTLQLSSALLGAGKSHNVLPLSGVTHMTPQEIVAENLLLTEVDFFRKHLSQ